MSIREMKVDDLKKIVELEKDLFLSPWNEEDFIHELKENPMAGYYILEKENQIIGYIGLWFLGDQCQNYNNCDRSTFSRTRVCKPTDGIRS